MGFGIWGDVAVAAFQAIYNYFRTERFFRSIRNR